MSTYTILVKLADAGNHKLTFASKPSFQNIKTEILKQARLAPEIDVILSAEDEDFPGTYVVIGNDTSIKDRMVIIGETKFKVCCL